jgi:hypothetical protein
MGSCTVRRPTQPQVWMLIPAPDRSDGGSMLFFTCRFGPRGRRSGLRRKVWIMNTSIMKSQACPEDVHKLSKCVPEVNGRIPTGGPNITVTAVELNLPPKLSYDQWDCAGRKLAGVVDSSSWWLGDWLVYGKREYPDRYRLAIKLARLSYQTLRNYAWVARRFEPACRRTALTFQHHAEVASLQRADQDRWLDVAEASEWSTRQLRDAIRAEVDQAAVGAGDAKTAVPKLEIPGHRMIHWCEAAGRTGLEVDDWVLHVLDSAAADVLGLGDSEE